MRKRKLPEWAMTGDCSNCAHKGQCKNACEPREERANAYIKKALLMAVERRNALC